MSYWFSLLLVKIEIKKLNVDDIHVDENLHLH
jgi:hypothetical protein